ncbi:unnamed protein product [Acanthoscelides obtectus]|uniref:PiggyBac transposable element-derived protein domain-containing protein n=1 Tax=Acanthoscelides obtectus TaxID=200917 RepID=A0A9P0JZQ7_ACAOB|nr:unnamed protein product [Acanthoscelides obtectus]CAK1631585.1 PiggyBac transposable element-derived protein 4 [Acanthoscelides obtectus]
MKQYWSKNPLLLTPFFAKCLSNKRFEAVMSNLHFADNETFDAEHHPNPKLNKIWPIYDKLVNTFRVTVTPEKHVAIDESILLYKGRLGWIQYIPLKRHQNIYAAMYGILLFIRGNINLEQEYVDLLVSSQVVMMLFRDLLSQGYCITMDNFYNSPQLADLLLSKQTDVYGTVKLTRKEVPRELKDKKLKKGEVFGFQIGKVSLIKWKDKKDISLISTVHTNKCVEVETRREKNQTKSGCGL